MPSAKQEAIYATMRRKAEPKVYCQVRWPNGLAGDAIVTEVTATSPKEAKRMFRAGLGKPRS